MFSITLIGSLLLSGVFGLLISNAIYNLYFHPLSSFPGPWYSKVSRFWHSYQAARKTSLSEIKRLHDEYGEVVRIAPSELSYSTGEAWKPIYGGAIQTLAQSKISKVRGLLPKDPVLYGAGFRGTEAFVDAEGSTYSTQRRAVGHAFTLKNLTTQMPLFSTYIDRAFEKLRSQLSHTDSVDVGPLFGNAIFDFNCKWTLDRDLGATNDEGKYHPSIEFVESPVLNKGFLHFNIIGPLVQERLELGGSETDLVLIATGTGTTAPLICAAVYYILSHPAVHSKLRDEIRNAAVKATDLNMDLVMDMKYLKAVMTEAIRLYPPVAGTLTRVTPKGGVEICGQFVPENTVVGVHHFATYHSARNFKYPDEFRPERWVDNVSEEFEGDRREALQPFSVGPRKCIAYEMASMSSKLFIARLLWQLDMELDEVSRGWEMQKGYTQFQKGPLMVKFKERDVLPFED